jgi:HSP20 family protein
MLGEVMRMLSRWHNGAPAGCAYVPKTDVYEDKESVEFLVHIPGVKRDDLKINVEDDTMTVRGERKSDKDEKEYSRGRTEIYQGSFNRSFVLPDTLDLSNIDARIEKGVLRIRFEKRKRLKSRVIKIEQK